MTQQAEVLVASLNIRTDPRVVNGIFHNRKGRLTIGMTRPAFEVVDGLNPSEKWARISEFDRNGKALWICVQTINGKLAKIIDDPQVPEGVDLSGINNKLDIIIEQNKQILSAIGK